MKGSDILIVKNTDEKTIRQVIELRIKYFREYYENFTKEQEYTIEQNLHKYFNDHLNSDCVVAVIKKNDKVVASAILNIFVKAPNRRFQNGKYGEIYGVYTTPKERRNGYATALIQMLINYSKEKELSFIQLDASEKGIQVYKHCGFIEETSDYVPMKYHIH